MTRAHGTSERRGTSDSLEVRLGPLGRLALLVLALSLVASVAGAVSPGGHRVAVAQRVLLGPLTAFVEGAPVRLPWWLATAANAVMLAAWVVRPSRLSRILLAVGLLGWLAVGGGEVGLHLGV